MKRPNILLIYTDQLRWDALCVNGNPDVKTPNIDRLVGEGVNFTRHFVQHPLCMPSRVSFLSGQYPSTLGITHMGVPVPEDIDILPHYLKSAGYTSVNIGKLHFLPHANRDHRLPHPAYGFDRSEISDEPGVYEDAYRAWVRCKDAAQLEHLSVGLPPARQTYLDIMGLGDAVAHPKEGPLRGARHDFSGPIPFAGDEGFTHSAFVAEQTQSFLSQQDGKQPFLCIAGFYSPHAPWVVPQRFLDLYDPETFTLLAFPTDLESRRVAANCSDDQLRGARHGYYAMISEVDHYVGELLATLEARGLAENTIVLFTADHGEWLGEHLKYGKGYPGDDAVSRVPLIIRWPGGMVAPGRTVAEIVEAVDVLPTLLEAAGLQIPPQLQGQSLLPALQNFPFMGKGSALMEHRGWKNLRTDDYRYLFHTNGREELWDLQNDPREYHDVATAPNYQGVLAEHRKLLLERLLSLERPLARTWPY
ncbi:alkaline phosphatase family protein [soil metagenome]